MLASHERKLCSQNGEDGVLEWLSPRARSKYIVEIGCGDGRGECQSRYLRRLGWKAILADKALGDWITAENINRLFIRPIGILSIDVDGNDYWLWRAITSSPDIVCIEYNAKFGLEPVTIPYSADWVWGVSLNKDYHGASLSALAHLGDSKGYQLLGCESSGTNAFFILRELGEGLPDLTPEQAYMPSHKRMFGEGIDLSLLEHVA